MCLQCHMGFSDASLEEQLLESLKNCNAVFPKLNECSISHLIICSSGFNGMNVRKYGIEYLNKYYNWLNNNKYNDMKEYLLFIEKNKCEHNNQDKLVNYLEDFYNIKKSYFRRLINYLTVLIISR